jgi:hypothetical protein
MPWADERIFLDKFSFPQKDWKLFFDKYDCSEASNIWTRQFIRVPVTTKKENTRRAHEKAISPKTCSSLVGFRNNSNKLFYFHNITIILAPKSTITPRSNVKCDSTKMAGKNVYQNNYRTKYGKSVCNMETAN